MALTASHMADLGTPAPDFQLPDPSGKIWSLSDFDDKDCLLVMFLCNHCPYVKHLKPAISQFAKDYTAKSLAIVAINANDIEKYPEDSPANMAKDIQVFDYIFPYLFDTSQTVAKDYRATCTPDFFLYDQQRKLAYRGQFDDSRPGNQLSVTGESLRRASDKLLAGEFPDAEQKASIGCNIKWR